MKSVIVALILCIPILLLSLAAHLYPARVRGAIYLAEWEFKMEREGVSAPPIAGDIRCKTAGVCKAESAAFTALLQKRFPAGIPERDLRAVLIDQRFEGAGPDMASYDWPTLPCVNTVLVAWRSDNRQRIAAVSGYYVLRCL